MTDVEYCDAIHLYRLRLARDLIRDSIPMYPIKSIKQEDLAAYIQPWKDVDLILEGMTERLQAIVTAARTVEAHSSS